ncbi:Nuclear mitotic apparatus protein 1, partial [Armadillidium vulgare]
MEKDVIAAKDDAMRVERELEKTIQSLKEELESLKEASNSDKLSLKSLRSEYKTKIDSISDEVKKKEEVEASLDQYKQKYEIAKKKTKEIITALHEAQEEVDKFKDLANNYKERLTKNTEVLEKERELSKELKARVQKYDFERQPLKDKLSEVESVCKRLAAEKRSLEAQLTMADSSIRELQKNKDIEGFRSLDRNVHKPSSNATKNIPKIKVNRESSVSSDDVFDSSTTPLIPEKKPKGVAFVCEISPTVNKDQVFTKPILRSSRASYRKLSENDQQQAINTRRRKPVSESNLNMKYTEEPPPAARPRRALSSATVTRKEPSQALLNIKQEKEMRPSESTSTSSTRSFARSVPREMVNLFNCEDEEEEFNDHKYLADLKSGRNTLDVDCDWRRVSELQRRNSLYPPHMRSAYTAEMQFQPPAAFTDDDLRQEGCAVQTENLLDLTEAAEKLDINSPPAFNLRKRKSFSDSLSSQSSLSSSGGRKSKRLSTSYSRPGPPTPAKKGRGNDKENMNKSTVSSSSGCSKEFRTPQSRYFVISPPRSRRTSQSGSPSSLALKLNKGISPANRKIKTPSSLMRIMNKAKSPWRKSNADEEEFVIYWALFIELVLVV